MRSKVNYPVWACRRVARNLDNLEGIVKRWDPSVIIGGDFAPVVEPPFPGSGGAGRGDSFGEDLLPMEVKGKGCVFGCERLGFGFRVRQGIQWGKGCGQVAL